MTRRSAAILAVLALCLATVTGALFASHRSSAHEQRSAVLSTLSVGTPIGRPIPARFLGLSLEYQAVAAYAGTDPRAPQTLSFTPLLTPLLAPRAARR